jgi:AcrR family transcriptional regulator
MVVAEGRRERKKAAMRQNIAETAVRLFLERGYDGVGIREIADEADVAVTTLFGHFACKQALVFEQDEGFEARLVGAVTPGMPAETLLTALRPEVLELVRHCTAEGTVDLWNLIAATPALREYENSIRLRHAESLAEAIAANVVPERSRTACRAVARFVIDAYAVAREADRPDEAVDEIFAMIEAAWAATPVDTALPR